MYYIDVWTWYKARKAFIQRGVHQSKTVYKQEIQALPSKEHTGSITCIIKDVKNRRNLDNLHSILLEGIGTARQYQNRASQFETLFLFLSPGYSVITDGTVSLKLLKEMLQEKNQSNSVWSKGWVLHY